MTSHPPKSNMADFSPPLHESPSQHGHLLPALHQSRASHQNEATVPPPTGITTWVHKVFLVSFKIPVSPPVITVHNAAHNTAWLQALLQKWEKSGTISFWDNLEVSPGRSSLCADHTKDPDVGIMASSTIIKIEPLLIHLTSSWWYCEITYRPFQNANFFI